MLVRSLVAVVAISISQAFGAVINVPADQPTIQAAIDASVDGDEIVVAPGTYFENINMSGKAVTLRSSGGADVTILDGNKSGNVITCDSGEGSGTAIEGFTITNGSAMSGAGMLIINASPTVIRCVFASNLATFDGGGIRAFNSESIVLDSVFIDNTAGDDGGGMSNSASDVTVIGCEFVNNNALNGGGMDNDSSRHPVILNSLFIGNAATRDGGAMLNEGFFTDTDPTVINCTFSGNSAPNGSSMRNNNRADPTVINCVFWNDAPAIFSNSGSFFSVTFSLVQGGFTGPGNIDADPLFVDPTNGDYRLSPGSPAIDAGDNSLLPMDVTTDLDGNPRIVNGTVDMGAYEFQGAPTCDYDCDNSGTVDFSDLVAMLALFPTDLAGPPCDPNFDGVDFSDLVAALGLFGPCP